MPKQNILDKLLTIWQVMRDLRDFFTEGLHIFIVPKISTENLEKFILVRVDDETDFRLMKRV